MVRILARELRFTLGRRGTVLVLFGVIYALIGMSYMDGNLSQAAGRNLHLALLLAPIQAWGVLWVLAGVLACVASHWPPGSDWWGYAVLSGLSTAWCACSLLAALVYGAPYGLSAALLYGCLTAALLIIAGWPEAH